MKKETTIEAATNLLEQISTTTTDVYQVIVRVEDTINFAHQHDLEAGGSRHYQELKRLLQAVLLLLQKPA